MRATVRKSRAKIPAPKKMKYSCVGGPWGGKHIWLSPGSTSSTMTFSVHAVHSGKSKVWSGQYIGAPTGKALWLEDKQ